MLQMQNIRDVIFVSWTNRIQIRRNNILNDLWSSCFISVQGLFALKSNPKMSDKKKRLIQNVIVRAITRSWNCKSFILIIWLLIIGLIYVFFLGVALGFMLFSKMFVAFNHRVVRNIILALPCLVFNTKLKRI